MPHQNKQEKALYNRLWRKANPLKVRILRQRESARKKLRYATEPEYKARLKCIDRKGYRKHRTKRLLEDKFYRASIAGRATRKRSGYTRLMRNRRRPWYSFKREMHGLYLFQRVTGFPIKELYGLA